MPLRIRSNWRMRNLLGGRPRPLERFKVALPKSMKKFLKEVEITNRKGLVVFTRGFKDSGEARTDPTGVECLINKEHMDTFLPKGRTSLKQITLVGISYGLALREKIQETKIRREFRIILSSSRSLDGSRRPVCSVRFHVLRKNNPLLADNIESYKLEQLLTVDWNNVP